ncbi:inositol monophosphatase family protein [Candidatus Spongiihabitans sp.]|uniref:inositol monophosphatase family protein n=1 Tax=Candidatus Spongiihabitans sp. TaxID=3101308 RepID=UPI003C7A6782
MNPIVNIGIKAARRAGSIIVRHIDRIDQLSVQKKGRNDFVSDVDRMAEEDIIDTIHYLYPNHRIIAEESGQTHSPDSEHQGKDEFEWIIDPLDGTTNYLHGNPNFAVSLGIRHQGRIEHGIIFDPLRDEIYTASRGQGAQLNNRRIRISGRASMQQSLICTGYPNLEAHDFESGNFDSWLKCFRSLLPKVASIRHSGSAVLDLASVACGRTDAFWQPGLKIWDIAAGSLLVREAKGLVADFDGNQDFLESGDIIAANQGIFNELLALVKSKLGATASSS